MLKVLLLGGWLPYFGLLLLAMGGGAGIAFLTGVTEGAREPGAFPELFLPFLGGFLALIVVAVVVGGYLMAVAQLTAMKAAVNEAAETPIALLPAYKSMLRTGWPTFGWLLLGGLVTAVGLIACILPGIYLYIAVSLIVPVMLFERREGFSRSFSLMHSNFWPAAGRVALLYLATYLVTYPVQILFEVVKAALFQVEYSPGEAALDSPVVFVVVPVVEMLVLSLITLLAELFVFAGLLATYAELRGRQEPQLSTGQLAAEANV